MSRQTPKPRPCGTFYTQINLASLTHSIWPLSNGFGQWRPITSYLWAPSANRSILCQNCAWEQSVFFLSPFIIFIRKPSCGKHPANYYSLESFYRVHKETTSSQYVIGRVRCCQSAIILNIMEPLDWRLTSLSAAPALCSGSNTYDPPSFPLELLFPFPLFIFNCKVNRIEMSTNIHFFANLTNVQGIHHLLTCLYRK